jgi:hypothetical protein
MPCCRAALWRLPASFPRKDRPSTRHRHHHNPLLPLPANVVVEYLLRCNSKGVPFDQVLVVSTQEGSHGQCEGGGVGAGTWHVQHTTPPVGAQQCCHPLLYTPPTSSLGAPPPRCPPASPWKPQHTFCSSTGIWGVHHPFHSHTTSPPLLRVIPFL